MQINTRCAQCGEVSVDAGDFVMMATADGARAQYVFTCPQCHGETTREATAYTVELVRKSGIPVRVWDIPAEVFEPHEGKPIDLDDVIDLHEQLRDL